MAAYSKTKSGIKEREQKRLVTGLIFVGPWIFGFLVFQLYPILSSAYYSFTEYNLFSSPKWVGLWIWKQIN